MAGHLLDILIRSARNIIRTLISGYFHLPSAEKIPIQKAADSAHRPGIIRALKYPPLHASVLIGPHIFWNQQY
ncbi:MULTISPECIES: hypothetical protein [Methanocorpusculum]|uniref:hypothetical protein n=1 Tax=Methanocorpusculum TaxID=2192 RepID=UPI0005B25A38|nr:MULTISPECIES: hypothetical protein [Methanocorpusculum]MDD4423575.1 hypothetical protein [Methanocorpusculum parvum]MDD2248450.1 hypothetical protein [Methanocorpusculum sp.]MDD2803071.1 hypothetical protein [Methanocorpusculum sp.]MDD3046799.1 hypothetical protein [Methanocorpusculum sp.]MDY3202500.1 hypothetical protein [Methanocorpusculum sp.]